MAFKGIGLGKFWMIQWQINAHISITRFVYYKIPIFGKGLSMIFDRVLLIVYGIDLMSFSINIKKLSIAHPNGILLGGNGIYSEGRVTLMSGVKFGGKSPTDPNYLEKHSKQKVFELGDNVVIGTGTTLLGPLSICDNVIIGSMSLVNKSITEPGVYIGIPVKKVSDSYNYDWV
jgi:serine O-acetyltransferase